MKKAKKCFGLIAVIVALYSLLGCDILGEIFDELLLVPYANPAAGEVEPGAIISLSSLTFTADIYYTTDGSEPTTNSKKYKDPLLDFSLGDLLTENDDLIKVDNDMTLRAIAVKSDGTVSRVMTAEYTVIDFETQVAAPRPSRPAGEVPSGTKISLSVLTKDDTVDDIDIYYTTDGDTPTKTSTKYTGAITVNSNMTIKAIATQGDKTSKLMTAAFTIGSGSSSSSGGGTGSGSSGGGPRKDR